MSVNNSRYLVDYGITNALQAVFPAPIVSKRAPTANDKAHIGQIWINNVNTAGAAVNMAYILTSIIANTSTWNLIESSGAGGAFTTLTSTGATTLATTGSSANTFGNTTGTTSLALMVGTGNFTLNGVGASTYTLGAATTTGTISIGGSGMTGALVLGNSGSGQAIQIGNAQTGGSISLGAAMTTGTISIGSATSGLVTVPPVVSTVASPSHAVTINARVGYFTGTGFTTAAAATEVFTVTNSNVAVGSAILATAINFGTNDAQMTVTRVIPAAGSVEIEVANLGSAALNGNLAVTFWILS